jgi:hypothetical protein
MARNKGALRVGLEAPQARLQRSGQQPVVGVQEHHVLALTVGKAAVARPGEPLVLLLGLANAALGVFAIPQARFLVISLVL